MNKTWKTVTIITVCIFIVVIIGIKVFSQGESFPKPQNGEVTIVEIGADLCIPCQLLSPIMEEITTELDGKAVVHKIVLSSKNSGSIKSFYDVSVIPVIIIFDNNADEITRRVFHEADVDEAQEWIRYFTDQEGVQW